MFWGMNVEANPIIVIMIIVPNIRANICFAVIGVDSFVCFWFITFTLLFLLCLSHILQMIFGPIRYARIAITKDVVANIMMVIVFV